MCRYLDPKTGRSVIGSCVYSPIEVAFTGNGGLRHYNVCINPTGDGLIHGQVQEMSVPLADLAQDSRVVHLGGPLDLFRAAGAEPVGQICRMIRRRKPDEPGTHYAGQHCFGGLVTVRLRDQDEVAFNVCLNPTAKGVCGAIRGTTTKMSAWVAEFRDMLVLLNAEPATLELLGLKAIKGRTRARSRV